MVGSRHLTPCLRLPYQLHRSATLQRGDYVGYWKELGVCLLHQFNPAPVAAEDIRIMRASFMLTHRVPHGG